MMEHCVYQHSILLIFQDRRVLGIQGQPEIDKKKEVGLTEGEYISYTQFDLSFTFFFPLWIDFHLCDVFLVAINSLLTPSRVIAVLGSPSKSHINFRDSKLTRILQPVLLGIARMTIICCAAPSELYLEETRSTLQFSSRATLVKTRARINDFLMIDL